MGWVSNVVLGGVAVITGGAAGLRTHHGEAFIHPASHNPYSTDPLPTVNNTGDVPTWEFVYVDHTQCMDKSKTGFWIREGRDKTKLMVYLMGGGACFNGLCKKLSSSNPLGFDNGPPTEGILRINTGAVDEIPNPLGNHTTVFVPYCTGDIFLGNQTKEQKFGFLIPTKRIFMGRNHVKLVMESLKASPYTSDSLSHFILTGESAGGFGSLANYDFLRRNYIGNGNHWTIAKGGRSMMIDDSGIVMNKKHLTPCLTKYWRRLYDFDSSLPPKCTECLESLYNVYGFMQQEYPDDVMAFISTTSDSTIELFYSYGFSKETSNGECGDVIFPPKCGIPRFKDGIKDFFADYVIGDGINTNMFASYFFPGTDHTHSTQEQFYYETQVFNDLDGKEIKLVDWYAKIVAGSPLDVESRLFEKDFVANMSVPLAMRTF